MGENKLEKLNMVELEWDSLLIPEDLSPNEKEAHASTVFTYLSSFTQELSEGVTAVTNPVVLEIDDSLLETKEFDLEKITSEELFTYFQEEKTPVNAELLFPKIKRINKLFWFLHNLGQRGISESFITIENSENLSMNFCRLIEGAIFFGFLKQVKQEDTIYFIPTQRYEDFMEKPLEKQYLFFLKSLGRNETVSELLQLQLNDPIFDNISRQMAHNILVKDPNIKNESLSSEEIDFIVNNFRYWYLGIKKMILK